MKSFRKFAHRTADVADSRRARHNCSLDDVRSLLLFSRYLTAN